MPSIVFGVLTLLVAVVAFEFFRQANRIDKPPEAGFTVPHIARELMTPTEKTFFLQLATVAREQDFVVAPQVAMSALVDVPAKFNRGKYRHKNRAGFAQKRLDFVLLDARTLEPLLVIELDDPTHDLRVDDDTQRDAILEEAGYAIVRIDVRERLSPRQLLDRLMAALPRERRTSSRVRNA